MIYYNEYYYINKYNFIISYLWHNRIIKFFFIQYQNQNIHFNMVHSLRYNATIHYVNF